MGENRVMMGCGHAANAVNGEGKPACAICFLIRPEATQVVADTPDLEGRTARCTYSAHTGRCPTNPDRGYRCGLGCDGDGLAKSDIDLPFFEHRPDQEFDAFYCGCWGWD